MTEETPVCRSLIGLAVTGIQRWKRPYVVPFMVRLIIKCYAPVILGSKCKKREMKTLQITINYSEIP